MVDAFTEKCLTIAQRLNLPYEIVVKIFDEYEKISTAQGRCDHETDYQVYRKRDAWYCTNCNKFRGEASYGSPDSNCYTLPDGECVSMNCTLHR